MVTHHHKDGHPLEGSVLQTWNLALNSQKLFESFFIAQLSPNSSSTGLLTLFQQKQEQQQPVIDFKNGVIVKIYKS